MRLRDVFVVGSSEKAGLAGAAQSLARPLTRRLKGHRRGEPRQADLVRAVKESGLFDPAVRKILKLVKGDPLKVSVGTAVLALVVSLDGDGATTYMICCAAMLPMYSRLGMSPRIMAGLTILAGGVMNMTPWGGPTARAASALHVDPSDIFVPMIPAMLFGVVAILGIAYLCGKRERARLGELHLPTDDIDHSEISVSQYPEARRPKLLYFNGALTAALMVALIAGVLPLPVLFMIAFSIAMIVNYPCLQQQKDRIAAHAGSVSTASSVRISAFMRRLLSASAPSPARASVPVPACLRCADRTAGQSACHRQRTAPDW